MLTILPPTRRKHRRILDGKTTATPTPPAPLVLVSAAYDASGLTLFLTFDRAVDVSGVDVGAFVVHDGDNLMDLLGADAAWQDDPTQCNVPMQQLGDFGGSGVLLGVVASNGIVAVDDGGTWDGVFDLGLPFP